MTISVLVSLRAGCSICLAQVSSTQLSSAWHSAIQLGTISLRKITLRITFLFLKRLASIRASARTCECFSEQKHPDMFQINRDAHSHALPSSLALSLSLNLCVVTRTKQITHLFRQCWIFDIRSLVKCTRLKHVARCIRKQHWRRVSSRNLELTNELSRRTRYAITCLSSSKRVNQSDSD